MGYNEILITFFALILLIMSLAGNVCYCHGRKCEHNDESKQMGVMPAIVEKPVKPAKGAKRKPKKKKR